MELTQKPSNVLSTMEGILANAGTTENGAPTHIASGSKLVDLFDSMGGLRHSPLDIIPYFDAAWDEDPLKAMKLVFLLRNPRGGLGERRLFDVIMKHLLENADPDKRMAAVANMRLLPQYGRWDDLLVFFEFGKRAPFVNEETPAKSASWLLRERLELDLQMIETEVEGVSLVAKWLPSENASSKSTRQLARRLMKDWKWDTKQYRQALKTCRRYLGDAVVETKMSDGKFDRIDFSKVCSKAGLNYKDAFIKRQPVYYAAWLERVSKGDSKINAGTLLPHEVIKKAIMTQDEDVIARKAVDEYWKNQTDYPLVGDAAVVIDVSPSMTFDPISGSGSLYPLHVSMALGTYLAERNVGLFHRSFLTFSSTPELKKLPEGKDITEVAKWLLDVGFSGSTDIQAVFDLILAAGKDADASNADMPKYVYIVTDGEFDDPGHTRGSTNYDVIKDKYANAGYDMPVLIFWNVQKRQKSVAMKSNDYGMLVSGFSPAILEAVASAKEIDPVACMEAAIEPYDDVALTLDTV